MQYPSQPLVHPEWSDAAPPDLLALVLAVDQSTSQRLYLRKQHYQQSQLLLYSLLKADVVTKTQPKLADLYLQPLVGLVEPIDLFGKD